METKEANTKLFEGIETVNEISNELTRNNWVNLIKSSYVDDCIVRSIDILGTHYQIIISHNYSSFPRLKDMDGYTDKSIKQIVVDSGKSQLNDTSAIQDMYKFVCDTIRHEIVHAFLLESGLSVLCDWATEEMVDWTALQLPKIIAAISNIKE